MPEVRPFRALRYDTEAAGPLDRLVAPPYDVISPAEREEYLGRSPYNVVHLTLPDSPEAAARDLEAWRRDGVLVEEEPAVWWVAQDYVGPDGVERTREGFAASVAVTPYAAGEVLPHERTHAGPGEKAAAAAGDADAARADLPALQRRAAALAAGSRPGHRRRRGRRPDAAVAAAGRGAADRRAAADRRRPPPLRDGGRVRRGGAGGALHVRGPRQLALAGRRDLPDAPARARPRRRVRRRRSTTPRPLPGPVLYRDGRYFRIESDGEIDAETVAALGGEVVGLHAAGRGGGGLGRPRRRRRGAAAAARRRSSRSRVARRGRRDAAEDDLLLPKLLSGMLFHPV